MKSKALYFNLKKPFVSLPLVIENMKKLWPLCLLLTLMYALSTAFSFLIKSKDNLLFYSEALLTNSNAVYMIGLVVFPIFTSVIVFKYLHSSSGVTVIHSMPFTKTTLFFTNYLSGAMVLIVPVILNTVLLVPVAAYAKEKTQMTVHEIYTETFDNMPFEVFSATHVLNWLAVTLLIMLFIYTLSVLAAIISGNIVLHVVNALLINFAPMYIFIVVGSYLDAELLGFSFSDFVNKNLKWFSPLYNESGVVGVGPWVVFIVIIAVTFLLANFLYGRRKLEKAGESLVFKFMSPISIIVIVLMMTSLVGTYVYFINGKVGVTFYAGFAAASLIALIVANMIVQKTPRIINKKTIQTIVAYGLIVGIFMLCVSFDVLGVEAKTPELNKIKSIKLNAPVLSNKPYKDSGDSYDNYFINKTYTFESPEAIKYITAFHKDMVNDPDIFSTGDSMAYTGYEDWILNIDYTLHSGNMKREYNVSKVDFKKNKNLMKLLETEEYKRNLLFETLGCDRIKDMSFTVNYLADVDEAGMSSESGEDTMTYSYETANYQLFVYGKERAEFLKCLDKDFLEQTAEELMSTDRPITSLMMTVKPSKTEKINEGGNFDKVVVYSIPDTYDHSIKWLKDHKYYDKLVYTANDVEKINVEVIEDNEVINNYTVTDPDEIKKLYQKGHSDLNSAYEYAVMEIIFKDDVKKRLMSVGYDGGGSGEAYDRLSVEENIAMDNPINRLYMRGTQKIYKDLIQQK